MTKTNRDSILTTDLDTVVSYFRNRKTDDVDQLAQRALSVIFLTDHLVQTGYEADTDPFSANMFACSALGAINAGLKAYPFVRVTEQYAGVTMAETEEQRDSALDSAENLIEMAEGLMQRLDSIAIMAVLADGFRASQGFRSAAQHY